MTMIEKAKGTGFCFGVRRALDTLARVTDECGGAETLGDIVHNRVVMERLAQEGVRVVDCVDDIEGDTVVTRSHGITPELEAEIRARRIKVVDTTCPFVRRAQVAAHRLADAGFTVIIYGDANHSEVKGILGWAKGKGIAAMDESVISNLNPVPRRIGILAQTTKIPAYFNDFVKKVIDSAFGKDSELRIIDTICHDIRERQASAMELADRVDLMIVVGGHHSSNTNQLAKLCSTVTETHLVETAGEIETSWLEGKQHIGVTGGASTDERSIDEVMARLESLAGNHS